MMLKVTSQGECVMQPRALFECTIERHRQRKVYSICFSVGHMVSKFIDLLKGNT